MRDGFIRVCAVSPSVRVADVSYNVQQMIRCINDAEEKGTEILVFPELSITGYTCGDLFFQTSLLQAAEKGLEQICFATAGKNMLIFVGLPFAYRDTLCNAAACVCDGRVLGIVPKTFIPEYHEFYEKRYFHSGVKSPIEIELFGEKVLFGTDQLFSPASDPSVRVGCEICEDLWVPFPPSTRHALAGANVIVNLSASNELVGKSDYRRELIKGQSARLYAVYVYASAGIGESTQDTVYSGHCLICENGTILAESPRFVFQEEGASVTADADVGGALARRRSMTTFTEDAFFSEREYSITAGGTKEAGSVTDGALLRRVDPHPFVPGDEKKLFDRCNEILTIQTTGLARRLQHTGSRTAVVGISGGLDSTLALIVTVRAFDALGLDRSGVLGITMPGFGTTDRTYDNACALVEALGATLMEIPIAASVRQHFSDIGHDEEQKDVVYENVQARERTQILMDVANGRGGLVVGTGDLSELALGWATYNGDHMSMYGVNASVPKTLVRHLVRYYALCCCEQDAGLQKVLLDVLDTPVSPELLPPKDGEIAQKTEDLVGPYELHDFFLYYVIRYGFSPGKIYLLARTAFADVYASDVILYWMKVFYRRFFAQQFKRSCLPDGPKVGTVALSPRGDWRMPSDASAKVWLAELEDLV